MSLLDLESFDGVTSAQLYSKWAGSQWNAPILTFPAGRTGNCVHIVGTTITKSHSLDFPLSSYTSSPDVIFGCALRYPYGVNYDVSVSALMGLRSYAGTELVIQSDRNSPITNVTVAGVSRGYIIPTYTIWQYWEVKFFSHATTGTCIIKINGTEVFNFTGDTLSNTAPKYIDFASNGNADSNALEIDDFYCCDSAGSDFNDFLGPIRVETLYPDGDIESDFTTSSGTSHFDLVNDASDATYVESLNINDQDLYDYAPLTGIDIRAITGIKVESIISTPDSGARITQNVLKSNITESFGVQQTIASPEYQMRHSIYEQDPNGPIAWTQSGVNALQAGLKING